MGIQKSRKPLILCADDYGMSPGVGAGIRRLVAAGRLSAVSCMTDMPAWEDEAPALREIAAQVDVGLHFNLTEGAGKPGLGALMLRASTATVSRRWVREQLEEQLELFEQVWGAPPDFVDGHQHVHVFPVIRRIVVDVLVRRYSGRRPWVRRVNPALGGHDARLKALVLRIMAFGFAALARRRGLRLSGDFGGLYSLRREADFPSFMAGWLERLPSGGLIMCHPGQRVGAENPALAETRLRELEWLEGKQFEQLCQENGVRLTPVSSPE